MKTNPEEIRKKYMTNPPEGMTSEDIRQMSEDDLLDMDYFLNEDIFDDEFGEEGFYLFLKPLAISSSFVFPTFVAPNIRSPNIC